MGFYYLQSRYYDPNICRFINADGLASTGQGFLGTNMFAYCNNNSVNKADHEGLCCNPVLPIEDDDEEGIVKYDVPLYNQGWTSLCWAFCQVMMEAYYGNEDLSQWEARQRAKQISIGLNGTGRKNWNVTGTPAYLSDRIEVNSIQELYDCLVEHGPLYANYQWENGGHSVIVTGVDVKRDIVYTNNPWGLEGQQTFSEFVSGVARRFYDPNHDYELYGLYYYDKP